MEWFRETFARTEIIDTLCLYSRDLLLGINAFASNNLTYTRAKIPTRRRTSTSRQNIGKANRSLFDPTNSMLRGEFLPASHIFLHIFCSKATGIVRSGQFLVSLHPLKDSFEAASAKTCQDNRHSLLRLRLTPFGPL